VAARDATVPVTSSRSATVVSGAVGVCSLGLSIHPMPMPNVTAAAMAAANPVIRCIDLLSLVVRAHDRWEMFSFDYRRPSVALLRVFNPGAYGAFTPA
jgi:hypothetical protein